MQIFQPLSELKANQLSVLLLRVLPSLVLGHRDTLDVIIDLDKPRSCEGDANNIIRTLEWAVAESERGDAEAVHDELLKGEESFEGDDATLPRDGPDLLRLWRILAGKVGDKQAATVTTDVLLCRFEILEIDRVLEVLIGVLDVRAAVARQHF